MYSLKKRAKSFKRLLSRTHVIKEKQPILKAHIEKDYDMYKLMELLYTVNIEHNHSNTLKALRVTSSLAKKENYKNGYYILNINFQSRIVRITTFSKEQENEASTAYSELEKGIIDKNNAVVLVSVPKMKELQEAYPSYFLDTTEFLQAIDIMMENIKKINIVSQ